MPFAFAVLLACALFWFFVHYLPRMLHWGARAHTPSHLVSVPHTLFCSVMHPRFMLNSSYLTDAVCAICVCYLCAICVCYLCICVCYMCMLYVCAMCSCYMCVLSMCVADLVSSLSVHPPPGRLRASRARLDSPAALQQPHSGRSGAHHRVLYPRTLSQPSSAHSAPPAAVLWQRHYYESQGGATLPHGGGHGCVPYEGGAERGQVGGTGERGEA